MLRSIYDTDEDGIVNTAEEAVKLKTARTISVTGDASGETSFDGSEDAEIGLTLIDSGVAAGTYGSVTVNAKGLVTSGSNPAIGTDTTSASTPSNGGTFTAVDSVTRDPQGHVTKINTKTVTIPTQTSVSGNAGTATRLATVRTISLTGDVTGSVSFNGSANAVIAATLTGGLTWGQLKGGS